MNAKVLIFTPPILFAIVASVLYYPKQSLPVDKIEKMTIVTPDSTIYENDCLHPCIRYSHKGFGGYHYWMVQSPYYAWNNKVENPILYKSNDVDSIGLNGLLLAETPVTGYNSDPNLYIDGDSVLYIFWRECETPLCDSLGYSAITVGISTTDGVTFSDKRVYLTNGWNRGDIEQAPVLMKHEGEYWFYATWYQYSPQRENRGIAIWKGTSLSNPDFILTDTILVEREYICDKMAELRVNDYRIYCPKPQRFDLWHFDLWEKEDNNLGIIACAEKGDIIMVGELEDWKYLRLERTPLIMNHYMQNIVGYRQYYYKPTAFVQNDTLHVFWTSGDKVDGNHNVLWHSSISMCNLPR